MYKLNAKVLYLGEKGTCIMENRVRLQEDTMFVFHNVIFLKISKNIQEFIGMEYLISTGMRTVDSHYTTWRLHR